MRRKPDRNHNDGLRKVCGCGRRSWPKCSHPWHFNFRHKGKNYRFSLARELPNRTIETKLQAETARDELTGAIRAGTFTPRKAAALTTASARATLTVQQLFDRHESGHVKKKRPDSLPRWKTQVKAILSRVLTQPDGKPRALGEWFAADVTLDAVEQFQDFRMEHGGKIAANRDVAALRAVFAFGVRRGLLDATPFRRAGVPTISKNPENRRTRRLQPGEAEKLLAACPQTTGPTIGIHPLRAVIETAIETGMRRGEIMSLQWWQVRLDGPRAAIVLPASKTKTRRDREVPISTRLRAILTMRQTDADGETYPGTAFVFGFADGSQVKNLQGSWQAVRLRAHGFTPRYVKGTAKLTPESKAQLQQIDLHFHDLRREAGSRWLDAGVPLHTIQRWLGHTNISQTSTYLAVTDTGSFEAMARFDAARSEAPKPPASADGSEHDQASLQFANQRTKRHDKGPRDAMAVHETPQEIAGNIN